jgi:CP family cyanate transporter-like MFS transporter
VVLVAGFVVASLNLRPALAGVSPLLNEIMVDLHLGAAAGGAITTVMVVCLGVAGPVAPALASRFGLDRTLLIGLLVLAAGVALRVSGGVITLYAGSAVAGIAIAIMNVSMPGVVKQHFPHRAGAYTGVYVSGLVVGAAGTSALMVPIAGDHGWRLATLSAAGLALLAAVLWAPQAFPRRSRAAGRTGAGDAARPGGQAQPGPGSTGRPPGEARARDGEARARDAVPSVDSDVPGVVRAPGVPDAVRVPGVPRPYVVLLRSRATWYITGFLGMQSLTFYIMLAWLPTIFRDAGLPADQAGYLLALTNLAQIGATLTVPAHAGRVVSQVPHVVAATGLTVAGYLGVLFAPATVPWLWMIVLGAGQGASLALALLLITLRAPDPPSVTALSAVAQTAGYVIAALGPLLIGLLHQLSGAWTLPLAVGLAACVVQLTLGVPAARPPAAAARRVPPAATGAARRHS